ncbi:MAG: xanthine dehydrogenase small subunit [Methyloligellaceae bacterium]
MRNHISFVLNGELKTVENFAPTQTVLNFLRKTNKLTGTKEGCAEGDCGACTVVIGELVDDKLIHRAVNACIQFVPMLDGKSITTVEGLADGAHLHPVQQSMVDLHGSQCGFCTPGFVMSLYGAYLNREVLNRDGLNDILAGNLCRCTGYGPIIDAGLQMRHLPESEQQSKRLMEEERLLISLGEQETLHLSFWDFQYFAPKTSDELAQLYLTHPDATIVAGATDVGLWVTKQHRKLPTIIEIGKVADLKQVTRDDHNVIVGAGVNCAQFEKLLKDLYPDFAELMRRFGSNQVRQAGTIGGNIANGSPIGDSMPALIALAAKVTLRKGSGKREVALEDFFISYGKQDRTPGEFVESISFPLDDKPDRLRCYKISKRFDQDISAICGCFYVRVNGQIIEEVRLGFGGMAGIPQRAKFAEQELLGSNWDRESIEAAANALLRDFKPLTDARGSAEYRMQVAQNLLRKYFHESQYPLAESRIVGQESVY